MATATNDHETIDDHRGLDNFAEASNGRDEGCSREECWTTLVAAAVPRRTIIAAHDAQQDSREYNP